ncbi:MULTISPECIES: PH domain-containing protein [unclassified Pseudactinotalea]|uniref:PH domain-containing protein n=1 Tax=unclassified Pseudactinotalea TaxID=2649176 RepID=UPI00128C4603|nr:MULTISPECIES: PH domain-containing protein [unclassified Pseudactinotalea]MPV49316.1 PH domain-containing protein [Pseudactinotalea sp. HY160]QGH69390.1 PH domain-containing protein [Pseudactinotalea sp. HY158]
MSETTASPLRPRATRWVAGGLVVLTLGGAATLMVMLALDGLLQSMFALWIIALALGAAVFLLLQALVVARATAQGLYVRNLVRRRLLPWESIVSVRFGPDRPWAQLDLDDGTTWPVMAIQSADGAYGHEQARRLAGWVQDREGTDPNP